MRIYVIVSLFIFLLVGKAQGGTFNRGPFTKNEICGALLLNLTSDKRGSLGDFDNETKSAYLNFQWMRSWLSPHSESEPWSYEEVFHHSGEATQRDAKKIVKRIRGIEIMHERNVSPDGRAPYYLTEGIVYRGEERINEFFSDLDESALKLQGARKRYFAEKLKISDLGYWPVLLFVGAATVLKRSFPEIQNLDSFIGMAGAITIATWLLVKEQTLFHPIFSRQIRKAESFHQKFNDFKDAVTGAMKSGKADSWVYMGGDAKLYEKLLLLLCEDKKIEQHDGLTRKLIQQLNAVIEIPAGEYQPAVDNVSADFIYDYSFNFEKNEIGKPVPVLSVYLRLAAPRPSPPKGGGRRKEKPSSSPVVAPVPVSISNP